MSGRKGFNADEGFMKEAIRQARKAEAIGDVPIGCVIVYEGRIIAKGYNRRNKDKTVLAHAELLAMKKACRIIGDWRLEDCTMYITLEPCPMCAGAIVQARVGRLVYGAADPGQGCAGSLFRIPEDPAFPHFCRCEGGVLAGECEAPLKRFFGQRR